MKMNQDKIEEAVTLLLEAIGEDVTREGLVETPNRIARMYTEIFSGMTDDAKVHLEKRFHVSSNEMVVEKDILFHSMCEHHFMPFFGKAHIAYIPNGEVVGLSKLARTVDVFAKRPQIQEQMTSQIADAIMEYLAPQGVCVMIEAEHMCMTMRGVKKAGSQTVTMVSRGVFETDPTLQNKFLSLIK